MMNQGVSLTTIPFGCWIELMFQPVLDFRKLTSLAAVETAMQPYLDEMYPRLAQQRIEYAAECAHEPGSVFLTERSRSLWAQLVEPPPLQPVDWVRSRVRRLFLVSLGVPVDLDEILPASKQKKLVLPSISSPADHSPRPWPRSRDGDKHGSADKRSSAATVTSPRDDVRSQGSISNEAHISGQHGDDLASRTFDLSSARILCSTTSTALGNLTQEELQSHIDRLDQTQRQAQEVLEYWTRRRESARGDKEAFEAVIENLVKHAKKVRK